MTFDFLGQKIPRSAAYPVIKLTATTVSEDQMGGLRVMEDTWIHLYDVLWQCGDFEDLWVGCIIDFQNGILEYIVILSWD